MTECSDNSRALTRRNFAHRALGLLAAIGLPAGLWCEPNVRRIVSTAPSITESLFALGLGDLVVGVSRYCTFPPQVLKLPKVGSYIKPDIEPIVRLAPDLVVLENGLSEVTDRLKLLGITYVVVPHESLEDVFTGITIMAQAAGVPGRSSPLERRIRNALRVIQMKARGMPSPTVVVIIDRKQGTLTNLTAVGPDNYVNQILEIAGGTNPLAEAGLPHYPQISLETIVRENPDVLVDLSHNGDSDLERQAALPAFRALWAQNSSLKAVRSGQIYLGTSNALIVPGPRAAEAAQILFDFLHPVARKEGTHG